MLNYSPPVPSAELLRKRTVLMKKRNVHYGARPLYRQKKYLTLPIYFGIMEKEKGFLFRGFVIYILKYKKIILMITFSQNGDDSVYFKNHLLF